MQENDMWKSVNFAITMAFMGDVMRESEDRSEKDIKLFGIKTELGLRINSLIAKQSEEKNPENLEKARALSQMLTLSMLSLLIKHTEGGEVQGDEIFLYLNEGLDLGLGHDAIKVLSSEEEEIRDAIKKSMKSIILMGLKTENMTDVLHLFKALAGLSRFAEEELRELSELKDIKIGATAAELGELALDASEMAQAEIEKDGKSQ